jgi:mitogen-activated protein kinase 1/3
VAIKRVENLFNNESDAKRILREIKILGSFDHARVIKLRDIIRPK